MFITVSRVVYRGSLKALKTFRNLFRKPEATYNYELPVGFKWKVFGGSLREFHLSDLPSTLAEINQ